MHYMGMEAAVMTPGAMTEGNLVPPLDPTLLAISVTIVTTSIMVIALLFSTFKYIFESK